MVGATATVSTLVTVEGHPKPQPVMAQVRAAAAGSKADVTYVRGGKEYDIEVTLGELAG